MLSFIKKSIIDECARKKEKRHYRLNSQIIAGVHKKELTDGPLYLKIMISTITFDSRSTVTYIRTTLYDLDKNMTRFDSDVTQFNDFVKAQLDAVRARGETSNNIMVFQFRLYLMQKINEYDDGKQMTEEELINFAENNLL